MKKILIYLPILGLILFASCSSQKKLNTSNDVDYNQLVEHQEFTFIAQTVLPTEDSRFSPRLMFPNGNNLYQLSSGYDVKITKDTVVAYLPFYGRSFVAPIDPSKGGIQFTSTNFDIKKSIRKKNHEITITPKDVNDIRSIQISITPSGYAFTQVLSLNRTPISFNGIIKAN